MTLPITRRHALAALSAAALAGRRARAAPGALRPVTLSYQESSVLLQVMRTRDVLTQQLAALGFAPVWSQLGHSLAELGQVDFQGDVAESVPVMIHQKLPDLILYAAEGPSPHAVGLLTHARGPVATLAMLKGRRIAVGKGGSSFDLLLLTLRSQGLSLADIEPVFLPEPGSAAAFSSGHVDGWATYDPFLSAGLRDPTARLLTDGAAQGMRYDRYYMVDRHVAHDSPGLVKVLYDGLVESAAWITAHPDAATQLLSHLWQDMPLDAVQRIESHRNYAVRRIDNTDLPTLAAIAARFRAAGLLPMDPDINSIGIWTGA